MGNEKKSGKWYFHGPMRNALIAGMLTVIAFSLDRFGLIPSMAAKTMYCIGIVLGGYHWMWEGIEKVIKEKEIGIEVLMIAAAIGSAVLGMWDEAAFLVFLYGTAEGIEEYTYARTRSSIRNLLDLAPKQASLLQNGKEVLIQADQLKVDDVFLVKPGETIATDGVIVRGASSINEAPVTGESMPVEKKEGMKVFAATSNQEGALEIRVTATYKDNTLSKIINLVEEAQEEKGKSQAFIERFGRIYSPLVLLGALFLLVIPYFMGWNFAEWAAKAVVLLVAAAPCALIMSTPVAIAAGIGKAGRSGILIKGGAHLETLGKIRVLAFDKTGTLTKGQPIVTDLIPLKGDERQLLTLAFSLERLSQHPLAKAIISKADAMGLKALEVNGFEALTGAGVRAKLEGQILYLGKPELFTEMGYDLSKIPSIEALRGEGKTVILLGVDSIIQGLIGIRDEIRHSAKAAIGKLQQMGIKTVMLTGDNEKTARVIAQELGLEDVRANLKPGDKTAAILELAREYGYTAMVGDGVNDAPALATASVGIAMGTAGTDAAIEAADVALMGDDLGKVIEAIHLGQRARNISRQNIIFSVLLLIIIIPTALMGMMSIAMTVFTHEFSEILAVMNGLRVARTRELSS